MLNREEIHSHLSRIRQYLDELEGCRDVTVERYLEDHMLRHAIRLIEAAIDINSMLLEDTYRKSQPI